MSTLIRLTLPMPRLGETMDQGTIAQWLVTQGEAFGRGDDLVEIETDKTLVEYPALGAGRLLETLVAPGDLVAVGSPIAVIETEEAWQGLELAEPEPATPEPDAPGPQTAAPAAMAAPGAPALPPSGRPRATPKARRLARQRGIAIADIVGTGRRGRVEAHDIPLAQPAAVVAPQVSSTRLLLLHGIGGMGSNWNAVRAGLAGKGLRLEAPDMPGHGAAVSDSPGIDDLIAWAVAQLDASDTTLHLVGHSLGAHIAAQAAAQRPAKVAALTLLAPLGCGAEINGRFVAGIAEATSTGELRHLLRLLGPKAATLSDTAVGAMAEGNARGALRRLAADLARGDNQQRDTIAAIARLPPTITVRAIFGMADMVVPREHVFNMPPRVACHIVRTGHMPHWDAPRLIGELISSG